MGPKKIADEFSIRAMTSEDIKQILHHFTFPWISLRDNEVKWNKNFEEQTKGIRTVYLIEDKKRILAYASFLRLSKYPNFSNLKIPEINDLWIDTDYRRQGFAKSLISALEKLALQEGYSKMGIGVGLYADYGPAQRLYCKLGYLPDACGITYQNAPVIPGKTYPLDDELILWLTKKL